MKLRMELPYSIFPPHSWSVVCRSKWLRRGSGFVVRRLIVSHGSSYPIHFCTLGHFFLLKTGTGMSIADEKTHFPSGPSCNSSVTVKYIFSLFLISPQYPGIGLHGVTGRPVVKHVAMGQLLGHGHVTIPLQLMVGQIVLVKQI